MESDAQNKVLKMEEFVKFKTDTEQNPKFKTSGRVAQQFASQRTFLLTYVKAC